MSNTPHSAAELLPELLNDPEVLNGEGSIAFTKPDRTTARLFLREGNIYAVDNLTYEARLWNELKFEKHISHSNLTALIRAHKSQRESLYKLLKKTRTKLKSDANLVIALQEYTLGAIDDIYSWESAKIEWRMGDTFQYDAAEVPPFPLPHLLTLCVNRSLFKFNKYEEWGFKNDDQFLYGNVLIEDADTVKTNSDLEETIILAKKFVIKGLVGNTGYSLFTIASALDDLSKRAIINIENPSGRQKPVTAPSIPHDVPVVRDKVHFSATDEDPDMMKVFNTAYHVPEPALLEDVSDSIDVKINGESLPNPDFDSFDDVINDTSSMEVVASSLPPLKKEVATDPTPATSRLSISQEDLDKEDQANDIAALYKSAERQVPKARGTVKKPVAATDATATETVTEKLLPKEKEAVETVSSDTTKVSKEESETPATTPEGKEMANESSLFELLQKVEAQLGEHRSKMEDHNRMVRDKESSLIAAKNEVSRVTLELNDATRAKEAATQEYEKALQIINALHN